MKINVISESNFSVKGHGVHTAFVEHVKSLRQDDSLQVSVNSWHSADIVHIHTVGLFSLVHLLLPRGKKVITAHVTPDSFIGSLVLAQWWSGLAKLYLRFVYNRADLVLAVSDETKRSLQNLGVKSNIEVFYNSIDLAPYKTTPELRSQARQKLGLSDNDWLVLGNGQVQPRKRIDSFTAVADNLYGMTFIWVGGIPFKHAAADYKKMQSLMKNAPSNTRFTGVIELDEVRDYYHAADVFLLPSMQETFGLVVIEAAAAGLPIVLRDIADYDQTFRGDVLMFENDNDLLDKLKSLHDDVNLYQDYAARSAKLAAKYDSSATLQQLVTTYKSLLQNG